VVEEKRERDLTQLLAFGRVLALCTAASVGTRHSGYPSGHGLHLAGIDCRVVGVGVQPWSAAAALLRLRRLREK